MHRTAFRAAAVAACSALPLLLVPGTAAAAPPVDPVEHYQDGPIEFSFVECGIPITATGTARGTFFVKPLKGTGGQAFLAHDSYTFTETWTTDSGQLTLVARGTVRETSATKVPGEVTYQVEVIDPGTGEPVIDPVTGEPEMRTVTSDDVFTFTSRDAGNWTWYGEDGKAVMRFTGPFVTRFQFDTLGDSTPGGVGIPGTFEVLGDKNAWPKDVDYCAVLEEHLG